MERIWTSKVTLESGSEEAVDSTMEFLAPMENGNRRLIIEWNNFADAEMSKLMFETVLPAASRFIHAQTRKPGDVKPGVPNDGR